MNTEKRGVFIKVPQATLIFWIMKIRATTFGETGGEPLSGFCDITGVNRVFHFHLFT